VCIISRRLAVADLRLTEQGTNVTIEAGRKWFHFLHADDQAASVELHPAAGVRPQVTALVEYATP
jgi:hypothetical protein